MGSLLAGEKSVIERRDLIKSRRLVIKVGSRVLSGDVDLPRHLAAEVAGLATDGRTFLIVSSGAISLGLKRLGYRSRPTEMAKLQAAAAAGQSVLMRRYDEAFGERGVTTAQVLLTHADLTSRERVNNARQALTALLEAGAVPIINENDTVATDEIRFGDNDQLASMVAPLVGADLLVLLTDVDGVLDGNGQRIPRMDSNTPFEELSSGEPSVGSGGMRSKIDAARKASQAGADVVVAPAHHPNVLASLLGGEDVGTLFPRVGTPLRARKHWIMFTLRPRGTLLIDAGAESAVRGGKSSLLPVGVVGLRGQFNPGDSVVLVGPDGSEVGRGLTRLGALDLARAAGKKNSELALLFGAEARDLVVVHKDDLVLTT